MTQKLPKITEKDSVILNSTWMLKTDKSPFILNFLSLQERETTNKISLLPMEQVIAVSPKRVNIRSTADAWNFLSEEHGWQMMHKVSISANEIFTKLESAAIEKYLALGEKNRTKILTKWQRFLNHYFGISFPWFIDKKRSLISAIRIASNRISSTSRRGNGTGVIVSPIVATELQDSPYFSYSADSRVQTSPIYQIGSLANTLQVIVDSTGLVPNNKVIIFRKTFATEPGIATVEFGSPDYNTVHGADYSLETTLTARVDVVQVGMESEAMCNYWTEEISFDKKPLWRKLLFI